MQRLAGRSEHRAGDDQYNNRDSGNGRGDVVCHKRRCPSYDNHSHDNDGSRSIIG